MCKNIDVSPAYTVRSSTVLTNAYVAGTVLETHLKNQLIILADFTIGSLDYCYIKVEVSFDGSTYYQIAFDAITAGVDQVTPGVFKLSATGTPSISMPIMARNVKISALGSGTVTNSLLKIEAAVGTV